MALSGDAGAVLRGAEVVDGGGAPRRRLDVEIDGGRIQAIGPDLHSTLPEIDLSGLVLSPGFIDPHTHYDAQVFWDGDLTPSCWHGVTTVVMGNCGFTLAPTRPHHREIILRTLEKVEGMSVETLAAGVRWDFETFPEYLREIDALPKRLNVACMIGHTTLRWYVLGDEAPDRAATEDEIEEMSALLREALEQGAIGFSTSRHNEVGAFGKPVPSRAATHEEIMRLAAAMADVDRGVIQLVIGPTFDLDAVVHMARMSGRTVTWSGSELTPTTFADHRAAAAASIDACDVSDASLFPQFPCRPVVQQVNLQDPFPFRTAGEAFLDVLRVEPRERLALYADKEWRSRAKAGLTSDWQRRLADATVCATRVHTSLCNGPTLSELAQRAGTSPLDVLIDLSMTDGLETRFAIVLANADQRLVADLLADRRCLLGLSDAGAHVSQTCDANYATDLLAYWVREQQAIPLELAVWHLTRQPAAVYGLQDRGRIERGAVADLVAFDAARIGSHQPERVWDFPGGADRLVARSTGVEWVWINGTPIRAGGIDVADVSPGRLIRSR
jgi:N-acyl-D-aspartate/D-glutamate deacylase